MNKIKTIHRGEHTEIKLHSHEDKKTVIKLSPPPGNTKLYKEALFISSVNNLSENIFPNIIGDLPKLNNSRTYKYEMEYYDGILLRDKLVNRLIPKDEILKDIDTCLYVLKRNLHSLKGNILPSIFLEKQYLQRMAKRLSKIKAKEIIKLPKTKFATLTKDEIKSIFNLINSEDKISINNKDLLSPKGVIKLLRNNPKANNLLIPNRESIRKIHGDPHFGNILIKNDKKPIYFDPNGFINGGDIAYDIGKFILSLDRLDYIYTSMLKSPEISISDSEIEIEDLDVFKNKNVKTRASSIKSKVIKNIIPNIYREELENDPNLIKRSSIVSDIHALSCASTFIKNRKDISLHLFIYHLNSINNNLSEFLQ